MSLSRSVGLSVGRLAQAFFDLFGLPEATLPCYGLIHWSINVVVVAAAAVVVVVVISVVVVDVAVVVIVVFMLLLLLPLLFLLLILLFLLLLSRSVRGDWGFHTPVK